MISHFTTAEEAQQAFYQAIERADLAQMMAVWVEDDDIVCVHPGGPRHTGIDEIRESWRRIFARGPELKFDLLAERTVSGRMLSVHSVVERIAYLRGELPTASAIATNIFVRSDHGWQMLVHHASPIPDEQSGEDPPSVLH
ncbi:MAG: nuclear transport factor 2 family protein [Betaproteobacteria bacterium]|nr:MAG: nuclear transport factor 2 family protein [Betaproteobacteria bacterium]